MPRKLKRTEIDKFRMSSVYPTSLRFWQRKQMGRYSTGYWLIIYFSARFPARPAAAAVLIGST
jgi:hypothetical protein